MKSLRRLGEALALAKSLPEGDSVSDRT